MLSAALFTTFSCCGIFFFLKKKKIVCCFFTFFTLIIEIAHFDRLQLSIILVRHDAHYTFQSTNIIHSALEEGFCHGTTKTQKELTRRSSFFG